MKQKVNKKVFDKNVLMNIDLLRKSDFNFCTLKYGGCSKLDMYLSTYFV